MKLNETQKQNLEQQVRYNKLAIERLQQVINNDNEPKVGWGALYERMALMTRLDLMKCYTYEIEFYLYGEANVTIKFETPSEALGMRKDCEWFILESDQFAVLLEMARAKFKPSEYLQQLKHEMGYDTYRQWLLA